MILFKSATTLNDQLRQIQQAEHSVGFIPTMGALHDGHISLINASTKENDYTVCSIFVNPTQFNDPKDFQKYPVTIEKDIELLLAQNTQILFLPTVQEIYPSGTAALPNYQLGHLETILEGAFRPGHFQGVCQVMNRLLEIVQPDHLYMGQKDYQQCMVVKKLLELMKSDTILHPCPTLRETSGLAMSSRNTRLTETEKQKATAIYQTLNYIKENIKAGNLIPLKDKAKQMLEQAGFRVDYVEIADAGNLELVADWDGKQKLVALAAAFMNEVRLIDNMIIEI